MTPETSSHLQLRVKKLHNLPSVTTNVMLIAIKFMQSLDLFLVQLHVYHLKQPLSFSNKAFFSSNKANYK